MTDQRTAGQQITEEVTSWPGVAAGDGRRGEFVFKLPRRVLGRPSTSERRMSPVSPTRSPAAGLLERSGRA
jgi:hypothetical protein